MTNNLLNLADLFRREINRVAAITNIMPHKLQRFFTAAGENATL